jgi:hypothetical protein
MARLCIKKLTIPWAPAVDINIPSISPPKLFIGHKVMSACLPEPPETKGIAEQPANLIHTPMRGVRGGPQLGVDGKDLKNMGHLLLLLLTVVGHLSKHHLQQREDQGEGWCRQGCSICNSK